MVLPPAACSRRWSPRRRPNSWTCTSPSAPPCRGVTQMSDPKPYEGDVTRVDVADQIIIGFKQELGALDPVDMRKRIADVLSGLQDFGVTKLQEFITAPPEKKALFAIAIIRLEGH